MNVDDIVEVANKVSESLDGDDFSRADVLLMLNGTLPAVIWNDLVTYRKVQGWTVGNPGDEYDEDKKIDPKLVVYEMVEPMVVAAYEAVYAVVRSLRFYHRIDSDDPVVPPGLQNMTDKQRKEWEEVNDVHLGEIREEDGIHRASGTITVEPVPLVAPRV